MQRATTTETRTNAPVNVTNILGFANETFPITGKVAGIESDRPGPPSLWTNDDLKIWSQSGGMLPNKWEGCEGLCFSEVPAAGFAFECTDPVTKPIHYGHEVVHAEEWSSEHNGTMKNTSLKISEPLFKISFTPVYTLPWHASNHDYPPARNYSYLKMDLLYTEAIDTHPIGAMSEGCPGKRTEQHCILRPAVVKYPVQIENFTGTHATSGVKIGITEAAYRNESNGVVNRAFNQTLQQQNGFEVLRHLQYLEEHGDGRGFRTISHLAVCIFRQKVLGLEVVLCSTKS